MNEPGMDAWRSALAALGAREAQRPDEVAYLRHGWEGHAFYLRERSTPVACHECDRKLERPYAVWGGQPSFARCLDDIDAMPTQSREPRGDGDEPHEFIFHSFAGVIVCDDV
jgi:hypothetical protein